MRFNTRAQSAVEYLLLLAIVGVVVMVSFRTLLPKTQNTSKKYFESVSRAIIGGGSAAGDPSNPTRNPDGSIRYENDPVPTNGGWCDQEGRPLAKNHAPEQCLKANLPCGVERIYRQCACPEPAFGGKHCMDIDPTNAFIACSGQPAASCIDCTGKDDSCDAPEPANCDEFSSGLTRCSQQPCTVNRQCGAKCTGPEPTGVTDNCPGAKVGLTEDTPWTVVPNLSNCYDNQIKCRKYKNP